MLLFFAPSRFNFVEVLRESDIRVMPIYPFYLLPFTSYLIEFGSINKDLVQRLKIESKLGLVSNKFAKFEE